MLGAIIGDIIGSVYEFDNRKPDYNFKPLFNVRCRFTDDTIHTVALMDSILSDIPYNRKLKNYFNRYPNNGHGKLFKQWVTSNFDDPYNSFGNGSAMRTSPIGWAFNSLDDVKSNAIKYASVTHNHPQGVLGAMAISVAVFLSRKKVDKKHIMRYIKENFYKNVDEFSYSDLVDNYKYDVTCQGTVPQSLYIFSIGESYEDCIRKSVSIGGDTDTVCAIVGGMAEAYYGVPNEIKDMGLSYLPHSFIEIINKFYKTYVNR